MGCWNQFNLSSYDHGRPPFYSKDNTKGNVVSPFDAAGCVNIDTSSLVTVTIKDLTQRLSSYGRISSNVLTVTFLSSTTTIVWYNQLAAVYLFLFHLPLSKRKKFGNRYLDCFWGHFLARTSLTGFWFNSCVHTYHYQDSAAVYSCSSLFPFTAMVLTKRRDKLTHQTTYTSGNKPEMLDIVK